MKTGFRGLLSWQAFVFSTLSIFCVCGTALAGSGCAYEDLSNGSRGLLRTMDIRTKGLRSLGARNMEMRSLKTGIFGTVVTMGTKGDAEVIRTAETAGTMAPVDFAGMRAFQDPGQTMIEQAMSMGQAFVKGDYKTFAKYSHPRLLQMAGGAAKMEELLTKTIGAMKEKGMSFDSVSFGAVTPILHSGNEWQSTIQQHTSIKVPGGRVLATSTLIAISMDKGVHWVFVDTNNKDITTMRQLLPNLHKDIVIPPQKPPVQYRD